MAGKARPLEEEGGWLSPPRAAMVAKNVGVTTSVVWCGVVEVCECWVRDIIDKKRGRLPLGHASSSTNCSASLLPPAAPPEQQCVPVWDLWAVLTTRSFS